ncbi:MAG: phage portal protein [Beijerinckiaceae bacterium]
MSKFLKALAWVAPGAAMRRAQALAALDVAGRYAGATAGRRASSFLGGTGTANNAIGSHLSILRARSREMVRDHWAFSRILDVTVAHAVGSGISVIANNGSDRLDRQAGEAFQEWAASADVTGEGDLHGLVALAVRSALEGGDSVIRFIDMGASDTRRVKMALQLWEGDIIDHSRDGTVDGRTSRLGVGVGPLGERTGYWMFPEYPGESVAASTASKFIARSDVVHLYRAQRPGQVRGVPVFAPILLPARDLADLMDAVIVKAKIEACFTGFVRKTGETSPLSSINKQEGPRRVTEFAPGMIVDLQEGEDITFANPGGNGNGFEAVHNATLYAMAAGAGITFDQLTGDLRQANYSSLRAGKIEFRRLIEQLQWLTIVPKMMARITERFASRAILAGVLRDRREGYRWEYVMPANEPIDPKKDLEADIMAVRAGRMSPQEFIVGWGRPWREVIADFGAFMAEIDKANGGKGIVLDIDPRKTNQSGGAQPAQSADPAQE